MEKRHLLLPQTAQHQILLGQHSLQVRKMQFHACRDLYTAPCHAWQPGGRHASRLLYRMCFRVITCLCAEKHRHPSPPELADFWQHGTPDRMP